MSLTDSFATSATAVVALGIADATALADLTDDSLLAAHSLLTVHRRHADILAAHLSGELARRSSRTDGYSGLAQRNGFGSAEAMIQALSPVSRIEATQLIQAGTLMATEPTSLWEAALSSALTSGRLGVAAVDAIRRGLAPVADSAPAADLLVEVERLLARVPLVSLDELRREARAARDRIDAAGIERRERKRRDLRYLKRWIRDDGMYQGSFLLDPEAGQIVFSALDAIIAPRRGVRFVDATAHAEDNTSAGADAILADTRTTDQLLADALVDMVRLATDADSGTLFGTNRPAVRVIVTEHALSLPVGSADPAAHGYLEGDPQPISRETVDRHICNTGVFGVKFDRKGQVIDLGRTQRLYSEIQRIGLSARDGGCLFINCTKPPSQCEAHHINEWERDHGLTNVRDGVLLCRHHHMLLHNNHWRITRDNATYFLIPPRSIDPNQVPRVLRTKSPVVAELAQAPKSLPMVPAGNRC